ncbi:hypothetical protein L1987_07888 [Smallanthus sonchifolius]|uniref:Uncharacterized protein n=1 Tax=Smallanthus sonchifolius TaxID=185202 RepID=A0ACB9JJ26_9ASTR|nr:hypothetical protein L1987_07888 [Smallanthus sonchifolius]
MHNLNDEQQVFLTKMGFEKMVHFNVDGIPSKLAYFVVDVFDPEEMVIRLKHDNLRITKQVINEILGVSVQGKSVEGGIDDVIEAEIEDDWASQYISKKITAKDIMEQMYKSNDADRQFELNFIMLFCTTMIKCNKSGVCNLNLVKALSRKIRVREEVELQSGGFGQGELVSKYEEKASTEEEYNIRLQTTFEKLIYYRDSFGTLINKARSVYPDSALLSEHDQKFRRLFTLVRDSNEEISSLSESSKEEHTDDEYGYATGREAFETFQPDCWVLSEGMLENKNMNDETIIEIFRENLFHIIGCQSDLLSLATFYFVFFPVIDNGHYYLICFDIKTPSIVVIDNINHQKPTTEIEGGVGPMEERKTDIPTRYRDIFGKYLEIVGNPKSSQIQSAEPLRLSFKWSTSENSNDCGIFLMRHMECYKGISKQWDCGFEPEGKKQATQILRLRCKYAAKILLSELNIHRAAVLSDASRICDELQNLKTLKKTKTSRCSRTKKSEK